MTKQDLREMFSTDKDLIEKWHIRSGNGIEVCVEDTWNVICNHDLYKLDYGYFSIEKNIVPSLGGFFIKPEMRNKETVSKFWNDVESKFETGFFAGVYNKNKPAINFLSKKGKIAMNTEDGTIFYIEKGIR